MVEDLAIAAPPATLGSRLTPTQALWAWPVAMISRAIRASLFDGVANPTPELEPSPWPLVLLVSIWSLRPITWPAALISGPPELPGLIGASVWIAFGIVNWLGALIVRPTALTMPAVTVFASPNGLPIAITLSPT